MAEGYDNTLNMELKNTSHTSAGKKVALLVIYLICLVLFFEGVSRLLLSNQKFFKLICGFDDDLKWRIEWIKAHKNTTYYKKYYTYAAYDAHRGWAVQPNLKAVKTDIGIISSNSRGIRGEAEYVYNPPRDKTRIMILGDSFTFGNEVANTETYAYKLQQMLPHSEVINMGVSGYGHDQMLLYLKEEGIKYKPNIVILGFVTDDMYRNMLAFRDYAKPKFELVNNELKLTNCPVPPPEVILQNEFYRLKVFDLLTILYQRLRKKTGLDDNKREQLTEAILDDIVKTVESIGAIPVFVYLPWIWELVWDDEHMPAGMRLSEEDFFFRYCNARKLNCLSMRSYFLDSIKKGKEFNDSVIRHYDAHENLLVAETINKFLLDKQLISYGK